jgi:hypothetical protein
MPQKTNLNINPYYDDYDKDSNFYRVLFKPGFPVQARELTTLQSILQNQIESFGSHIFKEGSMVIPGGITYDDTYYSIKINPDHLGIDVSLYLDQLIGVTLQGQTSGVTAVVDNYILPPQLGVEVPTLFIKYKSAGSGEAFTTFEDSELLINLSNIQYGNTVINSGSTVATVFSLGASAIGARINLSQGVYFIRGTFVDVPESQIILDAYDNTPSYRVGLSILEEIVTAGDDESLYDNAKGFSNFAAPGADRLKISLSLSKKSLSDFDDKNFVELVRLDNGVLKKLEDKTQYSIIRDYFAKRTFEESGDYAVDKFNVEVADSLNDLISSGGVFIDTQKTDQGNTPSEDLLAVKVSSGKAYVRGFDVESRTTTIIDVDKPRETKTVESSLVPFELGSLLKVNNVYGTPFIGINQTNNIVDLKDRRITNLTNPSGTTIGNARVYSFGLSESSYSSPDTQWDLYLFDIQTYTILELNASLVAAQCPDSSFVRGVSSGATGYVVTAPSGITLTLSQVSGNFIAGEQLYINETLEFTRSIKTVKDYTTDDIKSVYQASTSITAELKVNFNADVVLQQKIAPGFSIVDNLFIATSGVATCAGRSFLGIRSDTIIRYQQVGVNTATYNRVSFVSADGRSIQLVGISSNVVGVSLGSLPVVPFSGPFSIEVPSLRQKDDISLTASINSQNVERVNLSQSNLLISQQLRELSTDSNGTLTVNISYTGITSAFFESYDSDRYSVYYNDGTIENLTRDQVQLLSNSTVLQLNGLKTNQSSNVTVNATIRKISIRNKQKQFIRSEQLGVTRTVSAASTNITGLSTSFYYGVRVEDREISLNYPDVAQIIAVYESLDQSTPVLDKLTFVSGLNLDTAAIVGEKIIGKNSNAIAQVINRPSSIEIEFIYLNRSKFSLGEEVVFQESNIQSTIQGITPGQYLNITDRYALDKGQKDQYYDYSRIVRKLGQPAPTKRLLIIFNRYDVPINDKGDVYTVNSYDQQRYLKDIPSISNGTRLSDVLDFRPRVSYFDSFTSSPFDYNSRSFGSVSSNTTLVISPNESSIVGYSYYLPRIDKIVLNKEGQFSYLKGTSADNPKPPQNAEFAMEIANIYLPAYLYNPRKDAKITLVDNKRYTMRDIGKLENRIKNLEIVTSLTLLELNTKTLQVQDADGLSRFKTGFFVDDFKDNVLLGVGTKADINVDESKLITETDLYSFQPLLALDPSIDENTADFNTNLPLLDSNIRKTGELLTLNYEEKGWIEQPLASRAENVNPFNMVAFFGSVILRPNSDTWVRNVYVPGGTRQITGGSDYEFIEDIKIASEPEQWMRSRNIEFAAGGLRPADTYYTFLDSVSGIDIIPKILEITMQSGIFQIGETVEGYVGNERIIRFRVASPVHKDGAYNDPSREYAVNPYNFSQRMPRNYSASSITLNVDTNAMSREAIGEYFGRVQIGCTLYGRTSNAVATVSNIRLRSDNFGDLLGCFYLRDPLTNPPPPIRIGTGTKSFQITTSPTNTQPLPGSLLISNAETVYSSTGIVDTYRQDRVVVRRPPPPRGKGKDPLAQSFTVDETGAFLTSVDLFFASKDENERCFVEVREVELGTPRNTAMADFAGQALEPSQIAISTDATVPTRVTFPSPIYLESRREYAIVVLAPSTNNYELWVARMGERTVNSQFLPDAESVIVTKQYTGGSLFKSQNGSIWTASQFEDMKFKLYKANFTSTDGTAYFYNPSFGINDNNTPGLLPDPIKIFPRKLKVGITTTSVLGSILIPGTKVSEGTQPGPFGFIEKLGSRITSFNITNSGTGYTSSASYTNVPLYNITGSGTGATANLTFSGNVLSGITVNSAGNGYAVGDVLGVTTSSVEKGRNARITVTNIDGIDTLYLSNVQGESFTAAQPLVYYTGSSAVSLALTTVLSSSVLSDFYDGTIFEVTSFGHSMHSLNNLVQIKNIEEDTIPTILSSNFGLSDNTISVASTSGFDKFEGISTSRGFLRIGSEIMFYETVGSGSIGITSRGVDGTPVILHDSGELVYKYEFGGVSLTRINKTHSFPTNPSLQNVNDLDRYYLQIERPANRSSGDDLLSFNQEFQGGGTLGEASRNLQYSGITPQIRALAPGDTTSISAEIRTVSGTSAGGNEVSFVDQGFESVELNQVNFLSTTRLVASRVNESARLTNLPKNRSLTVGVRLQTQDPNLSPVIDLDTTNITVRRSKLNNPVSDYITDGRVNEINNDPHVAVYFSRRINLAQPATSLKVLIGANRPSSSDFRVLYRLFRPDANEVDPSFELFPGYDNLVDTDGDGFGDTIIDDSIRTGKPDAEVRASKDGEFLEYQFTVDNLSPFTGYQIKVVMSGTNESKPPEFKDLRTIALA